MNADEMKAVVAAYWRYQEGYPMVAVEGWSNLTTWGELADVLAVSKKGHLLEIEVKVTLADLKNDIKKRKHANFRAACGGLTHKFYFAVPREIANQVKPVVAEMYPYAGLLGCEMYTSTAARIPVSHYLEARKLSEAVLSLKELARMSLNQSATVCRLLKDVAEARQALRATREKLAEAQDRLKLEEKV